MGPMAPITFKIPAPPCDPFTGLEPGELRQRRVQFWNPKVVDRSEKLFQLLVDGASWEESTANIIASISKPCAKKPKRFKKKRVGVRQAKRAEVLDQVGEIPNDEQATAFRALAARANYLALDRPDICCGRKSYAGSSHNPLIAACFA